MNSYDCLTDPLDVTQMPSDSSTSSQSYVLGHSPREQDRLLLQAGILRGWTERFFGCAGLAPGMHVLDVGCGMGDASLLAYELVGPRGSVLGIDRDSVMIERAYQRAREQGWSTQIRFQQCEIKQFQSAELFDAVVGRYILHHLPDPSSILRHIATQVKPGGLLVFHDFDVEHPVPMYPEAPPLWS